MNMELGDLLVSIHFVVASNISNVVIGLTYY